MLNDNLENNPTERKITINIPITHDDNRGIDIYDIEFAYNEFNTLIASFENYNDMLIENWNEKQTDYLLDNMTGDMLNGKE
jgi:hypothetical protein